MIKGLFFARRKPDSSPKEFQEYWRTTHADITRPLLHIRHYIQSHTLLASYGNPKLPYGSDPLYDGMATMWFNNIEERRQSNMSPEAHVAIADQGNFTELSARRFLLCNEVIQKDGPADPAAIHLIALATRKPDMSVEAFQQYWLEHHGPLAGMVPGLRRYVQDHPLRELYPSRNAPLCDGVAEAWFDSLEDLQRSTQTPQLAAVRADEPNFMDVSKLVFILTHDIEIYRR
jgi:uncharacterized protein (TIGR02118 family)